MAAIAAMGFWLWTVFHPSPETVIRKRINKVAALLSFTPKEGRIARIASVQRLAGYFSPEVEIIVDSPALAQNTLTGRDELTQRAMGVRMALGGLSVRFLDVNIGLSTNKSEATVSLTAEARVDGDPNLIVQELKILLRKIDGEWLIVRIETVRTLT